MSGWRGMIFLLIVSLGISGCFSTPLPAPTLAVPLSAPEWGEFVLHVYDDTGLITSGRQNDEPARPGGATAFPERQELDLNWAGGACNHRPILKVTGNEADLRLELEQGPSDPSFPLLQCAAVGILLGVTLSLSAPVAQEALTLQVVY